MTVGIRGVHLRSFAMITLRRHVMVPRCRLRFPGVGRPMRERERRVRAACQQAGEDHEDFDGHRKTHRL